MMLKYRDLAVEVIEPPEFAEYMDANGARHTHVTAAGCLDCGSCASCYARSVAAANEALADEADAFKPAPALDEWPVIALPPPSIVEAEALAVKGVRDLAERARKLTAVVDRLRDDIARRESEPDPARIDVEAYDLGWNAACRMLGYADAGTILSAFVLGIVVALVATFLI